MSKNVSELPDDIEVIGPGQMLAEARQQLKMTTSEVAGKLNFRVTLVESIEQEKFDDSLPDTFNRGYLKNYAKLVGIAEQDILASYEMLGVAAKQGAEMQSFSKITEKEAQHSRLMWVSYLILATLIASSVLYWLQDAKQVANAESISAPNTDVQTIDEQSVIQSSDAELPTIEVITTAETEVNNVGNDTVNSDQADSLVNISTPDSPNGNGESNTEVGVKDLVATVNDDQKNVVPDSIAIFTFAGDCWVNIHDGNGERVAWGIKKAGYVMELKGVAPYTVTVGKPELVTINFDGQSIDMSKFNVGNIAKFTLPESL